MSSTPLALSPVGRRIAAVVSVLALTGVAAACSSGTAPAPAPATSAAPTEAATSAAPTPTPAPTSAAPSTPSPSSAAPSADDDNSALLAAGATARDEVSGATVVSIESEGSGWEVTVVTDNGGEQSLRVSADGSDVTSGPRDERPDAEDRADNRRIAGADISYREAVRVIEREVDNGLIRELNLDEDDGGIDWEADVRVGNQQRSVEIDGNSGRVISNRADD